MMNQSESATHRLDAVRQRIAAACSAAGRTPDSVRLLAVSKTRGADEVRALHALRIGTFGENYAEEAMLKMAELADLELEWHFIGPLQSNKTRQIAAHFDWVQSVDREKIVRRLAEQRPADRPPLQLLIQVNIDREPQKAGCMPEQIDALVDVIRHQPRLTLRGLMAIPSAESTPAQTRAAFERMHALYQRLADHVASIDTLSMGMSDDLEAAIEAGSTLVRVGTALFGPRRA